MYVSTLSSVPVLQHLQSFPDGDIEFNLQLLHLPNYIVIALCYKGKYCLYFQSDAVEVLSDAVFISRREVSNKVCSDDICEALNRVEKTDGETSFGIPHQDQMSYKFVQGFFLTQSVPHHLTPDLFVSEQLQL